MEASMLDFPMPIITPRLVIRPPRLEDSVAVSDAITESMDILSEFMPWARETPSLEDTEEFIRQSAANWLLKRNEEPYLPLLILDVRTDEFIGALGYHHWDWEVPRIEIGYWQRKSFLGQGYMTEAVNAATQYAFKQLQMRRCSITCDVNNIRSKKIAERLNYTFEATLKSNIRTVQTNELSDTLVYARYDLSDLPELEVHW